MGRIILAFENFKKSAIAYVYFLWIAHDKPSDLRKLDTKYEKLIIKVSSIHSNKFILNIIKLGFIWKKGMWNI